MNDAYKLRRIRSDVWFAFHVAMLNDVPMSVLVCNFELPANERFAKGMKMLNGTTVAAIQSKAWPKPVSRDAVLQTWLDAKKALDAAKDTESRLRVEVVGMFEFPEAEGTQRVELGNGYSLKCVKKLNYKLDALKTDAALDAIEALGAREKLMAERLVKFKPEMSISEYRSLPNNVRGIIDEVLTISPGMPTLELEEPKK